MLILLYGKDSYRLLKKAAYLEAKYKEKHAGLSIKKFDFEKEGEEELLPEISYFKNSQSLFESVKLGIIKNAFAVNEITRWKKILLSLLEDKTVTLILLSPTKPPVTLKFLLSPPVQNQEFTDYSPAEWRSFITSEASERKIKLSPVALNIIQNTTNKDPWLLINELDKIALLKKPEITPEDLTALGLVSPYEFFYALRSLTDKEVGKRTSALEILRLQNEDPAKIFNILAYQREVSKITMACYDQEIKSGRLEYEETLLEFVLTCS